MERASPGELTDAIGRVLVLSSDRSWALRVVCSLQLDGFAVALVERIDDLHRALGDLNPEIVLVDGAADQPLDRLCASVRTASHALVFALGRSDADVVPAVTAEADAFARRSASPRELIARLRALLRRRGRIAADLRIIDELVVGSVRVVTAAHLLPDGEDGVVLDAVSYEILAALLKRPGAVIPRQQLLQDIGLPNPSGSTLDLAVRRLRDQLEPHIPRGCIAAVRGVGYRYVETDAAETTTVVGTTG